MATELAGGERKIVSILFADLAGSTELATGLDAERFREVMSAFYEEATRALGSLRGRPEKFVGDAVMAIFGLPIAHEDDALRAVRAGFVIRDRTARLAETLGLRTPLRVRVGVNSGDVATGGGGPGEPLVSGATVTLAARLQEAAEPGEVLVGDTTRQLTRGAVEYGRRRIVAAKGFGEEVAVWPVVNLTPRSSRRTIPLVGRRGELQLMTETFERSRAKSRPHLFTLLGEPGIGKTRLGDELLARVPEGTRVLVGTVNEFEDDPTFAPVAHMIRHELEVERETPPNALEARLREVVARVCDPRDVDRVVAQMGLALGVGGDRREERRYRGSEIRAGFLTYLEARARDAPILLVFEDLHHARPELLDFVEELLRGARRIPLMVLCLARDALLEIRPQWAGGLPDATTLRLESLALEDSEELAAAAGKALDRPIAERIARQAGGNPFFIVETTGMLLQEPRRPAGARPPLPPTVQAVVASRLDHLPEEARELVRRASVFPDPTISESRLALIAEPNERILDVLRDREVLLPEENHPGTWKFRHEMLREVAYGTLSKRDRMGLHLRLAEGLGGEGTGDRHPNAVAYHLEHAARASLDLTPADRTLPDRAVAALSRAGDLARRRIQSGTAIDLYERALSLAGPERGWGEREAWIISAIGEARYWLAEFEPAASSFERALRLGEDDLGTVNHASRFLADIYLNVGTEPGRAAELFERALMAARKLDDPWVTARTLLTAGWEPYWRGDLFESRRMFEEALSVARENPENDLWAQARALTSLASVVSPAGSAEECLELGRRALDLGREVGDPFTVAVAHESMGASLRKLWRLPEALPALDHAVATFRDLGARWELASALGERGSVHRLAGRLAAAEHDLREALDLCRKLGERALIVWTATELVRALLARDNTAAAREVLGDPAVRRASAEPGSQHFVLEAEALIALVEGDRETALERARGALEILRTQPGWRNPLAAEIWWVAGLFGADAAGGEDAVAEARRTLEAASWWRALEDPEISVWRGWPAGRRSERLP